MTYPMIKASPKIIMIDSTFVRHLQQAISLHLVQDLLPGFGLAHQVGVRTTGRNKLLDISDFNFLLSIQFDLIRLLFRTSLDIRIVVAGPIAQLLLLHHHHVSAHPVEEILGMTNHNKNLRVGG